MAFASRLMPTQLRPLPSYLLPVNWVEVIKVSPGQKIAVLGNNTGYRKRQRHGTHGLGNYQMKTMPSLEERIKALHEEIDAVVAAYVDERAAQCLGVPRGLWKARCWHALVAVAVRSIE